MNKPEVGQELWQTNMRHRAKNDDPPQPVTVVKVGRKYFTTATKDKYSFEVEYHVDNWMEKSSFMPNHYLYTSLQAWEDQKEATEITSFLRNFFSYGQAALPLETLRQIKALCTPEEQRQPSGNETI